MNEQFWLGKRVLLSGASGFIGSHTLSALVEFKADVAVTTATRPVRRNVRTIPVTDDFERELKEFNPEVIIHLATKFIPSHSQSDIPALIESNVTFGTRLLNVAAELSSCFVTTSSAWQHYQGHEYSPTSLYAATKQAFVTIAQYYQIAGLDFRELTLFDSYGPEDPRGKLISILMSAAASGEPLDLGPGTQLIDLLYVTDTVSAVLSLADCSDFKSAAFVARSGNPLTIRELVDSVEKVSDRKIDARWGMRAPRSSEMISDWRFGVTLPNWKPQVPLESGLYACWKGMKGSG